MENEKNLEELQEELAPAEIPEEDAVPAVEEAAEEAVLAVEVVAEDAAPAVEEVAEEIAPVMEEAAEEEAPLSAPITEGAKATPAKIAVMVVAIVLVLALIVGLLAGMLGGKEEAEETLPADIAEETVAATVPADGNPNDATCKGTYTAEDAEVKANADTVVATIGEHTLTNGQLQVFYWMQVQNFLSSEYGSYMMYYGVLDYTQPLDTQLCAMEEGMTWQQFFLREALTTWQNYCALADHANTEGMELPEESLAHLENFESELTASAEYYGLESVEELMRLNVGAGASVADYAAFQELLMRGNLYYDAEYAKFTADPEELEAFFAEHEAEYSETGITKDGTYVDVRHILVTPKGGTTDESGTITYSEEEWAACAAEAEAALKRWTEGEQTEEAFAALANELSEDPGSNTNGGLYEDVYLGQMVPEFEAWCFDESRQTGDTGIVRTSYGDHVMYYVGSTPIWQTYVRQDLINQKSVSMMQELIEDYPLDVNFSAINLGYVNLAA